MVNNEPLVQLYYCKPQNSVFEIRDNDLHIVHVKMKWISDYSFNIIYVSTHLYILRRKNPQW